MQVMYQVTITWWRDMPDGSRHIVYPDHADDLRQHAENHVHEQRKAGMREGELSYSHDDGTHYRGWWKVEE